MVCTLSIHNGERNSGRMGTSHAGSRLKTNAFAATGIRSIAARSSILARCWRSMAAVASSMLTVRRRWDLVGFSTTTPPASLIAVSTTSSLRSRRSRSRRRPASSPRRIPVVAPSLRTGAMIGSCSSAPSSSRRRCFVVRPLGVEPRTCGLRVRCSAIELEAQNGCRVYERVDSTGNVRPQGTRVTDGTRTRDSQYHKLELYQLSYGHHEGSTVCQTTLTLPIVNPMRCRTARSQRISWCARLVET